jgi:phosphate:Na+ symporter
MLIGSNIGTAITAFLASINADREAKKVAMANAFINVFGMLVFIWWIQAFATIVADISPKSTLAPGDPLAMAETIPRQIANAHTLFNLVIAAIVLPFTGRVAWLINRILPEKPPPEEIMLKTMYLDERMVSMPALGLNLAKQEALRIGNITQDMVSDVIIPFLLKKPDLLEELDMKEKQVDFLTQEVNAYLTRIIRQSVEPARADEAFQIMYTLKELEEIADIIGNLLVERAGLWIRSEVEFSGDGKKELVQYHNIAQKQLSRALDVFRDLNLEKARMMKSKHKKYRVIASEYEKKHYERLRNEKKPLEESGDTHMELMTRLRTITHHATNIARILLDWKSNDEPAGKK